MDNTEAVEKLAGFITNMFYIKAQDAENISGEILAAIQADPLAYVKPKPLEFKYEDTGFDDWSARSAFGEYRIADSMSGFALFIGKKRLGAFDTLEAAQAAAYDDRLNRVKELF